MDLESQTQGTGHDDMGTDNDQVAVVRANRTIKIIFWIIVVFVATPFVIVFIMFPVLEFLFELVFGRIFPMR